jgi:hypothetical protein
MPENAEDMKSPSAARILPGVVADIGRINFLIARGAGLALGTAAPNIFTTLAGNRSPFRRWLWFAGGLMPGGRLPRADTELVILRPAHNCASDYERRAHERRALSAGLTVDEAQRVRIGQRQRTSQCVSVCFLRRPTSFTPIASCRTARGRSCDHGSVRPELIELYMLVGRDEMLAMTLNSLRVQP